MPQKYIIMVFSLKLNSKTCLQLKLQVEL